jgi:hypothetical protein
MVRRSWTLSPPGSDHTIESAGYHTYTPLGHSTDQNLATVLESPEPVDEARPSKAEQRKLGRKKVSAESWTVEKCEPKT